MINQKRKKTITNETVGRQCSFFRWWRTRQLTGLIARSESLTQWSLGKKCLQLRATQLDCLNNAAKALIASFFLNSRSFTRKPASSDTPRSFVHWILQPLYKIFAQIVGDVDQCLTSLCTDLGIHVSKTEAKMNIRPLMRLICRRFFGDFTGFTEMCVQHVASPKSNSQTKVEQIYTGPTDEEIAKDMFDCNPEVSGQEVLTRSILCFQPCSIVIKVTTAFIESWQFQLVQGSFTFWPNEKFTRIDENFKGFEFF